ncbi:hypothetical protein SAMN02799630_04979 [Paenibacillus sp. UNCCL117]|uniref:CBO0543 family protein n=1 Tax=unclassified Paenibacillus TaxID=185978 RepID=UPI00088F6320|nr:MULTISPECIES: CBO0543 family protein [unclassified Paenibacillus]SDE18689.1 hypothetical protein SAMN04488602_1219 [Paenibacillus sp. cl123]SFW62158.1 hypothetical protein SAMN02799630_04979 [Paenibacillus sp. UNCCL117]
MHLFLALSTVFAAWKWGDWRNWKQYHPTMLYITSGGMLYEYLTHDRNLWVFNPDFLYNQKVTVLIYAILTMPLNVLLYLSTMPRNSKLKMIRHILLWIGIYAVTEWLLQYFNRIDYAYGWTFWYSVLFDCIMFPMLLLHHRKPAAAYLLSIFIIWFLMFMFQIKL